PSSRRYDCDWNLVCAAMAGTNPLAQNLWDMRRSLDVLAAHPLVDADRVGACGLSYGGTMTLFLAACDERVRAAVVSGYLSSWEAACRMPYNMCGSQVMWGQLGELEHVDIGALIAPRALLAETGTEDLIFQVDAARATVASLRNVYDAFDAGTRLEHDVFEGPHMWHGARAYDFLAEHL
ncbi:MAG TPA: acetylxylan esterase, partial [Acidimicrobiia bacterium]